MMLTARINPLSSAIVYAGLRLSGRVSIQSSKIEPRHIRFEEQCFGPFRHIKVDAEDDAVPALFWARFDLPNVSFSRNRFLSNVFMPFFVGLPGFREKYWCVRQTDHAYLGLYQWASEADARNYARSFAPAFMTARAEKTSVRFGVLPNTTLARVISEPTLLE